MSFFDDQENPNEEEKKLSHEDDLHNADGQGGVHKNDEPHNTERKETPLNDDFWAEIAAAKPLKRKTSVSFVLLMIIVTLMCGLIVATAVRGRGWLANLVNGNQLTSFTLPIAETPKLEDKYYDDDGRYTTEGIAKAISPSVVSIQIYETDSGLAPTAQGSGIVMSEDGYILTNAHVVDKATKGMKVTLNDNSEYEAKLVGKDTASDIAVIKIPATGLQAAQFGDSEKVNVGEDVVAIGSPAGFFGSVTKGIVSGLDRSIKVEKSSIAMNCIQIDAAINPGNSGGALLNMWGQVIGITSSKLASSDYDGIGFAIAITDAKPIIENLMEYGYVQNRVRVGITFYSVSETTAQMYGAKAGIYVVSIDPDCDIAKTELQPDDIITEFDGQPVSDAETVQAFLAKKKPGDVITAKVYRPSETDGGEEFEISFSLMEDKGSFIETDSSQQD